MPGWVLSWKALPEMHTSGLSQQLHGLRERVGGRYDSGHYQKEKAHRRWKRLQAIRKTYYKHYITGGMNMVNEYRSLRQRRMDAGFHTASDFARSVGLKEMTYIHVENGTQLFRNLPSDIQKDIASGLGCKLSEIMPDTHIGCKGVVKSREEIESMLEKFGDKLQPIKCELSKRRQYKREHNEQRYNF